VLFFMGAKTIRGEKSFFRVVDAKGPAYRTGASGFSNACHRFRFQKMRHLSQRKRS
jgi:hypothetical protein